MRILFNEDVTASQRWKFQCPGKFRDMDWIKSTVENECLGLGYNGAFPISRFLCDTPHIEFIIESHKDTFIEMKRTITQPKLSFLLPGTWAAAGDVMMMSRGPASPLSRNCHPRLWSWCMLAFLHTWLQITTIQGTGSEDHRGAQWRCQMWQLVFSRDLVACWAFYLY